MNLLRNVCVLLAVVAGTLAVSAPAVAQTTLTPGKQFEGVIGNNKENVQYRLEKNQLGGHGYLYVVILPITLKAGQDLQLTATVVGKSRIVGIQLFDPTQKQVGQGYTVVYEKTANQKFEEVSATGVYFIHVYSDRAGAFKLRARVPSNDESSKEVLEKRLKELKSQLENVKRQIAETEAKLRADPQRPSIQQQR